MVEWKKLGDCLDFEQPTAYLVNSTEYDDSYSIPVLTAGQSLLLGYTNEKDGIYKASKENPCIIFDDFTTSFHWIDYDFKVKSSAMKMLRPKKEVCFRYVYYAMRCIDFVPGGHQRHWISKYSQFEIPYPSLSEQQRIVGILDTFTASINNLKEQIAQRRKQYEYYRDQLLDLEGKEGVEMKLLSSISTIKVGPFGSLIHKKDYVSGGIPLVNPVQMNNGYIVRDDSFSVSEETAKLLESYTLYTGDVVFARRGEIGRCAIVTENESNFICGTGSLIVRFKDIINSKFMLFMFNTPYCKTYLLKSAVGGSMLNINCDIVGKMQIPVPPLSEQQRIVSILDTFEASIQNLEAQLSQREKQYDYYRNKLLTFE